MQLLGIILGVLGVAATVLAWLFPEARHAVLTRIPLLRTFAPRPPARIATKPEDLLDTGPDAEPNDGTANAFDFINLGEHLWYLANSSDQPPSNIGQSISAFTKRLEKCDFEGTRAAAKSIEATTVGQLQSQMAAISSSLYAEATTKQGAFLKLGEFLWYLSNPKIVTTQALEAGITGLLGQLDKCGLASRKAAEPLERFRYVYLTKYNLVAGASLDQLASIMVTIHHRIEHETGNMTIDD